MDPTEKDHSSVITQETLLHGSTLHPKKQHCDSNNAQTQEAHPATNAAAKPMTISVSEDLSPVIRAAHSFRDPNNNDDCDDDIGRLDTDIMTMLRHHASQTATPIVGRIEYYVGLYASLEHLRKNSPDLNSGTHVEQTNKAYLDQVMLQLEEYQRQSKLMINPVTSPADSLKSYDEMDTSAAASWTTLPNQIGFYMNVVDSLHRLRCRRKRFYFVRHGETDPNRQRVLQGSGLNASLNARGREQAQALAGQLSNVRIDLLVSSHLKVSPLYLISWNNCFDMNSEL
jgi:hypothetical protein